MLNEAHSQAPGKGRGGELPRSVPGVRPGRARVRSRDGDARHGGAAGGVFFLSWSLVPVTRGGGSVGLLLED